MEKCINLSQPPGRPIVSDVNTESSRVASFIDFYVNKHIKNLKSFLRDSFELVKKNWSSGRQITEALLSSYPEKYI